MSLNLQNALDRFADLVIINSYAGRDYYLSRGFSPAKITVVPNGIDGILVPPEDVEALAAAMDHLMSNEVERRRLAERAVEVSERFGTEKIVGQWEKLFRNIISSRRSYPRNS